jgi:hypothetical protein
MRAMRDRACWLRRGGVMRIKEIEQSAKIPQIGTGQLSGPTATTPWVIHGETKAADDIPAKS